MDYQLDSSSPNHRSANVTQITNKLAGLIRGVILDNVVNKAEADGVREWIKANPEVSEDPVAGRLLLRIQKIYADGKVSPEELEELRVIFKDYSGIDDAPTTIPLDDPPPAIEFTGKHFCFTGTFLAGGRAWCETKTALRGGFVVANVVEALDYLVIGSKVTGTWANSSYGRKIEKALHFKSHGSAVKIVSEVTWLKYLNA